MSSSPLVRAVAVLSVFAALSLFLIVPPACADGVSVILSPINLSITEGDTITFAYTITNNTGATITSLTPTSPFGFGLNQALAGGDITDEDALFLANPFFSGSCLSLSVMSSGAFCNVSVSYDTASGAGETDGDFGQVQVYASFDYLCPNCPGASGPLVANSSTVTVTINDPTTPAPEPSSLLLLGIALLSLLTMVRSSPRLRRLARPAFLPFV